MEKDNGNLLLDCGRLPIFYNRKVAKQLMDEFSVDKEKYTIQPVPIDQLEKVLLGFSFPEYR